VRTTFTFPSLHNITCVNSTTYARRLREIPSESLSQTGFFRFLKGNFSIISAVISRFGRGGAYSINMPAAKSSARVSTHSLIKSRSLPRKLVMRLSRVNLNCAIWPLLSVSRYWTKRRSRSSAVRGGLMVILPRTEFCVLINTESFCNSATRYICTAGNWTVGTTEAW
jgi:hypothetical protein